MELNLYTNEIFMVRNFGWKNMRMKNPNEHNSETSIHFLLKNIKKKKKLLLQLVFCFYV